MKFKFSNNKLPPINSIILICIGETNIIGIVESTFDDNIVVLMLDRIGKIIIHKDDNWTQLNVSDLQSLRNTYKVFINGNVENIINNSYQNFKARFLDIKK